MLSGQNLLEVRSSVELRNDQRLKDSNNGLSPLFSVHVRIQEQVDI